MFVKNNSSVNLERPWPLGISIVGLLVAGTASWAFIFWAATSILGTTQH
jgi:hypothetical protein